MFDEQSIGFVRPSARNSVRCVCMHGTTALCPWSRRKSSQLRTSYKQQACRFTCAVSHSLGPNEQRGSTAPKRVSLSLSLSTSRACGRHAGDEKPMKSCYSSHIHSWRVQRRVVTPRFLRVASRMEYEMWRNQKSTSECDKHLCVSRFHYDLP